jgi:hypothetical protein
MPIEVTDKIDAIGVEHAENNVILTIIDSTDWKNEENHLHLLQDKLNTYLRFLESGEILEKYPDASGRSYVISIIAQYEPTEKAFHFLSVARHVVEQAGFGFRFELRDTCGDQ